MYESHISATRTYPTCGNWSILGQLLDPRQTTTLPNETAYTFGPNCQAVHFLSSYQQVPAYWTHSTIYLVLMCNLLYTFLKFNCCIYSFVTANIASKVWQPRKTGENSASCRSTWKDFARQCHGSIQLWIACKLEPTCYLVCFGAPILFFSFFLYGCMFLTIYVQWKLHI